MTDSPDPTPSEQRSSFRTCTACHCRIHRDLEVCPECGAFPNEHTAPRASRGLHMALAGLMVLLLAAALFLLSREREAARAAELQRFTLLAPVPTTALPPEALPTPTPRSSPQPTRQPAAQPTVQPTPTPAPTPSPSPAPPAFNPADLGLPADPTPVPTSTPAPSPTPGSLELRDEYKADLRHQLDQRVPLAQPGDPVVLNLRNGRSIRGTLVNLNAGQVRVRTPNGDVWLTLGQLTPESRMRVDAAGREAWLEEKALEKVLEQL